MRQQNVSLPFPLSPQHLQFPKLSYINSFCFLNSLLLSCLVHSLISSLSPFHFSSLCACFSSLHLFIFCQNENVFYTCSPSFSIWKEEMMTSLRRSSKPLVCPPRFSLVSSPEPHQAASQQRLSRARPAEMAPGSEAPWSRLTQQVHWRHRHPLFLWIH